MDQKSNADDVEEGAIEIEMKFVFDQKCEERLLQIGAALVRRLSFYDVYYDNRSHDLILNNYWLRCRDDQWELKCPPRDGLGVQCCHTLQYAEYDRPSDILTQVRNVLKESHRLGESASGGSTKQVRLVETPQNALSADQIQKPGDHLQDPSDEILMRDSGDGELQTFLRKNDFKPFASFRTERTKYRVGDDIIVDLDVADFGYSIGEIEVMVESGQQRDGAVKKINDFAQKLGKTG
ncbi:hypothetical protein LSH36_102g07005 [Paralvinella palmiformis]|uniref:CYTH domain-containing protein n=1 Tax=Paralvinella palmiformis TaxID=53620 RepID=A0AAD9JZZ6_9ANNE|nr:hypothetical protein LSH36_102g07005 [Paralvinella palmiformis]